MALVTQHNPRPVLEPALVHDLLGCFLHDELPLFGGFCGERAVSEGQFLGGSQVVGDLLQLCVLLHLQLEVLEGLLVGLHEDDEDVEFLSL